MFTIQLSLSKKKKSLTLREAEEISTDIFLEEELPHFLFFGLSASFSASSSLDLPRDKLTVEKNKEGHQKTRVNAELLHISDLKVSHIN